jgi:hypothetical protein
MFSVTAFPADVVSERTPQPLPGSLAAQRLDKDAPLFRV